MVWKYTPEQNWEAPHEVYLLVGMTQEINKHHTKIIKVCDNSYIGNKQDKKKEEFSDCSLHASHLTSSPSPVLALIVATIY